MKTFFIFLLALIFYSGAEADWQEFTSYPGNTARDVIVRNGTIYAVSYNSGVFSSSNDGVTWLPRNTGLNNTQALNVFDIASFSSGLFIATTDGIYKSTDEGAGWVKKSDGLQIGPGAIYIFAYSLFEDTDGLYAGTYNSIYKSTNNGESWFAVTPITGHLDICSFHRYGNMLLAGTSAGNRPPLMYSTNNGLNWTNMYIWNTFPTSAFCIYSEPGKIFAGAVLGMWLSTNNGVNWIQREEGLGADPYVFDLVKVGNTLFAATNAWIYKTTNDGINWEQTTFSGQTFQDVNKLLYYNNKLYVAAYTGVWYRNIEEIVTGVENPTSEIPNEYVLSQNYPNPFNPVTKIEYSIPKQSSVTIKVFDYLGKEIQTLINEIKPAGSYTIDFNASTFSSGVYFYKLEADKFVSVKKMSVIK